jgi:histidinol-phosphate aminotransferase
MTSPQHSTPDTRHSYFRPAVENMEGYVPGEQPKGLQRIIKLNTNENPYPPSPAVKQALDEFPVDQLCRYPDPMSVAVRASAGKIFGLNSDWVLAGNGSDDLLTIAVRCFSDDTRKVACMNPGYSLYPILTDIQGAELTMVELTKDFGLPINVLDQIADCNLFFLTRPNAPTGIATPIGAVRAICEQFDGIVLIDEAYADFADDHCVGLVRDYDNVIVTRTVSKSYSLANVRLGVAFAQPQLIQGMMKVKDSYNVNGISQAIGEAAFGDQEHLASTSAKVIATRSRVSHALEAMGFELTNSQTNFLFAKPPCAANAFFANLKAKGILLRYFSDARCADYVRITIGTDEEMDTFLAETEKTLSELQTSN